jgi:hypothetical protein
MAALTPEDREWLKSQILAELAAVKSAIPASAPSDDKSFIQSLVMEIAEINDQGSWRKRVPPETMRAWKAARERMNALIASARAEGRPARYRVMKKMHLGYILVQPFYIAGDHSTKPVEIDWDDVPNHEMMPLNDTAREIFAAFIESVGTPEWKAAEERVGVTPGGLVVYGAAVNAKREVTGGISDPANAAPSGLKVHHRAERGGMVKTHVLGSLVPPSERRA